MSLREVLTYPDPFLKRAIPEGDPKDPKLAVLFADLTDTLASHHGGVGLAAPQIGESVRAILVDVSACPREGTRHGPLKLVNPHLLSATQWKKGREGCMSLPRLLGNIKRAQRIFVEAFDDHGIRVEYECEGYEAVAVQHEIDHLDGILFPDRVKSPSDLMERQVRTEGSPTRDDSRRIQAVFFDLDATLLDDSEAIGRAWNAFRKSCEGKGLGGDWEKLKRVHERHAWQQWVLGDNPEHHDAPETILEKAWVLTLQEEPREGFAFPDELARDFVACMEEAWKLYEEVPPVLDALLGRVRLAVVTNGGTDFQNRKFKRLGLKQWFEAMFVSQTHGFTKPDPRLFLTACRSLGVEPGRCLMVGDSWERDVEGGLAAGLKACWLDRSGKGLSKKLPESTGLITRLTELIPWMDRFES